MYNVRYDRGNGLTSDYLGEPVATIEEAHHWMFAFINKYVGKPMPNGLGNYPYTNARIVKVN